MRKAVMIQVLICLSYRLKIDEVWHSLGNRRLPICSFTTSDSRYFGSSIGICISAMVVLVAVYTCSYNNVTEPWTTWIFVHRTLKSVSHATFMVRIIPSRLLQIFKTSMYFISSIEGLSVLWMPLHAQKQIYIAKHTLLKSPPVSSRQQTPIKYLLLVKIWSKYGANCEIGWMTNKQKRWRNDAKLLSGQKTSRHQPRKVRNQGGMEWWEIGFEFSVKLRNRDLLVSLNCWGLSVSVGANTSFITETVDSMPGFMSSSRSISWVKLVIVISFGFENGRIILVGSRT